MSEVGVGDPGRLGELVTIEADYYRVRRVERWPEFEPGRHVSSYDDLIGQSVLTVGSGDARRFAGLVPLAVADVERVDSEWPDEAQPNLGVLNVLNDLQIMGLSVPAATMAVAANWPGGMQTANRDPETWHWERGLAALAVGDLVTARALAGVPMDGPTEFDVEADPEFNIQAWLALFVAAVLGEVPSSLLATRWEQFVLRTPVFAEIHVLALRDLSWVARILRHTVAGEPLEGVADWLHHEVFRIAGLSSPS